MQGMIILTVVSTTIVGGLTAAYIILMNRARERARAEKARRAAQASRSQN